MLQYYWLEHFKYMDRSDHPENLDNLIANYDRALSHPSMEDLDELKKSRCKLLIRMVKIYDMDI